MKKDKFQVWTDLQRQKREVNSSNNPLTEHLSACTLNIHMSSSSFPAHAREKVRAQHAWREILGGILLQAIPSILPTAPVWRSPTCPGSEFGAPLTSDKPHVHATEQKLQKYLQLLLSLILLININVFLKQLYIPTFINKHFNTHYLFCSAFY